MSTHVYLPIAPVKDGRIQDRTRVDTLRGKVVGIIDNSKNNFDHLADRLAELLVKEHGVKSVIRHRKKMASIPAPADMLGDIAGGCDVVITGLGD